MFRYKLNIEYDGTNYSGWQKQNGRLSIQETIEDCIFCLSKEKVDVFASGRTDAGVHAINQYLHFDLNKLYKTDTIIEGLNFYLCEKNRILIKEWQKNNNNFFLKPFLQQDIAVKDCELVDNDFHARFSTKMRHYRYIILNKQRPSALWQNKAWHIRKELDIDKMQTASDLLIGKHDFSSFRDSQCQANSPIKTMSNIKIYKKDEFIYFDFSAKSFLHHMIRNIVGTLKDVGNHKINVNEFKNILESKDRKNAGEMASPCGLYLLNIDY